QVLRQMGGEYAAFVEDLEMQEVEDNRRQSRLERDEQNTEFPGFPPLEDFSVEPPVIVFEDEIELPPIEMQTVEVATITLIKDIGVEIPQLSSAAEQIRQVSAQERQKFLADALAASLTLDPSGTTPPTVTSPSEIARLVGLDASQLYDNGIVLKRDEIAHFAQALGRSIEPEEINTLFRTATYGEFFGREISRMPVGEAQSATTSIYTYAEVIHRLDLPASWISDSSAFPETVRHLFQDLEIEFPFRQPTLPLTERTQTLFQFQIATLENREGDWVIVRDRGEAWRYVESLPEQIELEMVAIPAGEFLMGSPDNEPERSGSESPQHRVTVPACFMGRYPVTQAQWQAVVKLPQVERELEANPSQFKGDDRPVERVSWADAIEFCARLSRHTKKEYRLPSEVEWEYACRAGTQTPFHFGDMITTEVANYNRSAFNNGPQGNRRGETTPVTEFGIANAFGLSDMHGNVWEWCQDPWHGNYEGASPTDGSAWIEGGNDRLRVRRGGSWNNSPRNCRSASRFGYNRGDRSSFIGFRVVCAV
ncbi:MAG: formylglycine-generating enzyme family protein, partial [Cyanobacteria bacterium P01_A01_bin.37]